jgi:hypothetical protein
MSELFMTAAKKKLRFETPQGLLSVEDLWDLPLSSSAKRANLDDIAIALDRVVRDSSVTSFVKKATKESSDAKLRFDVVMKVIEVRQAELEASEREATRRAQKQRVLELIARKEDEALAGKSVDELKGMIDQL